MGCDMHKKAVQNANRNESKEMVSVNKRDSDFNVWNVTRRLFGRDKIVQSVRNNIGFACGLPRAIQFGNFAKCRDIVERSYDESLIIG